MKKIIALLLTLVMVLSLAACGQQAPADDGADAPADEPKTVAFVGFGPGDFFDMLANTYMETMKAEGWNAEYTSGNFDPPTQIAAAENYIAMGVDVLVIWSVAPEAMAGVIDQAMAAGIKGDIAVEKGDNAAAAAAFDVRHLLPGFGAGFPCC